MLYLLYLLICLTSTAQANNQQAETIENIIASAHIPQTHTSTTDNDDDSAPFVSSNTLTLSPLMSPREQQKMALREQFRRDLPEQKAAQERFNEMKKDRKLKISKTSPNKPMQDMNFIELIQRKNELILEGEYKIALKYLEQILKMADNPEQPIFAMLEMAELLMRTEQYAKAEKVFTEFIQLYPGNEYVEQAFVKAIQCSWEQTSTYDRDQTKTEDTLTLITRFESRQAICSVENVQTVAEVKHLCTEKLAQANLYVAKHYIGRSIFRSAHKRLDDIRQKDLCKIPDIEPQLLQLEIELAQAEKDTAIEQAKFNELITKFPQHEITLALLPKAPAKDPENLITAQVLPNPSPQTTILTA